MVHHGEKSKSSSLEQFLPFKFFFSCLTVAIQALFWDFMLEPNSISDHMSVMLMPDIAGMHLQAFTRCPCFFILKTIFHNQQKQSPALELGLSVFPLFSPVLFAVGLLALWYWMVCPGMVKDRFLSHSTRSIVQWIFTVLGPEVPYLSR